MTYTPPQEIIDKYAAVLVDALSEGKGIKKGQVVLLQVPDSAKPLFFALRREVLRKGGHTLSAYYPAEGSRDFFELASKEQLQFYPEKFMRGRLEQIDQMIQIIGETDKKELVGIDPKKIMLQQAAMKPYVDLRHAKEQAGKLDWVLALYGTQAMADEAGMTLEEYWEQIIKACYLDEPDPVQKWRETRKELRRIRDRLNKLTPKIDKLHIKSAHTDLTIGLGEKRAFMGGTGRNIPSFEHFTSPDCRVADGVYCPDQPLYRYGVRVTGIRLEFKNGVCVKATAKEGENVLQEMVKQPGGNRIGEFSLTDKKFSRITKFMGETLFDENVGGKWGNTHIALGRAYTDCYAGDEKKTTQKQFEKLGYNNSVVHTDMVSTENRVVTAILKNGKTMVLYKDGEFQI